MPDHLLRDVDVETLGQLLSQAVDFGPAVGRLVAFTEGGALAEVDQLLVCQLGQDLAPRADELRDFAGRPSDQGRFWHRLVEDRGDPQDRLAIQRVAVTAASVDST